MCNDGADPMATDHLQSGLNITDLATNGTATDKPDFSDTLSLDMRIALTTAYGIWTWLEFIFTSYFNYYWLCPTGLSLLIGTYVICRMDQFLKGPGANKTDINELLLFEHRINSLNSIAILMQLVRIWLPPDIGDNCLIEFLGLLLEFSVFLSACHRAFGSLVIAGVRCYILLNEYLNCNYIQNFLAEFYI